MIRRAPRPDYGFTIIHNATLRDSRLSWRARGLLAYILSLPDNWTIASGHLEQQAAEGREAVRSALRELETYGYLTRHRFHRADGTWGYETIVYDLSHDHRVDEPVDEPVEF
jgi:hypothetical protein